MFPLMVIQCRYGSKRLPGKALYPLAGMPMVVFLLRRLKPLSHRGRLILATTEESEDDAVAAWGRVEGIDVVRGHTDNVLARFLKCMQNFTAEFTVRITADNPLTDPGIVVRICREMQRGEWDYIDAIQGYPVGCGADAFSFATLKKIAANERDQRDREHLNAFILDHPDDFRCKHLSVPPQLNRPDVNLSVDTREDWERVSAVVRDNRPDMDLADAIAEFDRLGF
jgi:spore coat polysaccharide biosynthesis protein SpsF